MKPPLSFKLDTARPRVTATCPFCQHERTYTAGYTDEDLPVLLHETPHCPEFERYGVNDFLKRARLAGARVVS